MLEKYHLMPRQWDRSYPYDYLTSKLVRDLQDKDLLQATAAAKEGEAQENTKKGKQ